MLALQHVVLVRLQGFQLLFQLLNLVDVKLLLHVVLCLLHIGHELFHLIGELGFFFFNFLLCTLNLPADLFFFYHLFTDGPALFLFLFLLEHVSID